MYVVCVTFEIHPDMMSKFLPLVAAQANNSLEREPGCHRFDVCIADDGLSVFLYEHYTDAAAFEIHLRTDHFDEFDAKASGLVRDKKVQTFTLLDDAV
ncbi:MAG: putative quinol monooxygenase [Pseudomonadota bacterium]